MGSKAGISYTQEQQEVIDARACSLLVSAAAGSGKTAVLVERIVRMVSDPQRPVDIDRLLIVTFTNAAAAEMRERISAALGRRLEEEPDNEHLQRQMTLLHNAQITTIDSFCLFVIRNNFNDIGLDPGFRVADEGELKLLRGEVMTALMEDHFAQKDGEFLTCVESFHAGGDEKALAEHILRLYEFSRSHPFPEQWLQEAARGYAPEDAEDAEAADWLAFAREDLRKLLSACVSHLERALSVCGQPDGPYMYAPLLEKEREMLACAADRESFRAYGEAVAGITFGRLPSKKDETVSLEKRELVKAMRTEVKEALDKAEKRYFFLPFSEQISEMQAGSGIVRTLVSLTLEFSRRMTEKKQEKNLLDFSDMEHYALEILLKETPEGGHIPSETAREYQDYFQEIIIDEYQDSNLVQEYVLQSISGEETGRYNRFMVGDVKQSIYKFRLARPEIFMEKYRNYQTEGDRRKISLHKNFRSRKEVTDEVNDIFSRIMGEELGGVAYDEEAALYPGAVYPPYEKAGAELLLLAREEGSLPAAEQEAHLVARRIRRLLQDHQVTDTESGLLRPVRYGDITILLRSNVGWDETMQNILKQYGIPAYRASSTGYFSSQEIRTMLHFLRILDNPLQDIPLFGVMTSSVGGFTEQEIAQLRAASPKKKLYEALCESADAEEKEGKGRKFLSLIQTYRGKTVFEPVRQILREVMAETGYMQYMTAFPEGDIRRANLEMLLLKAAEFEKTGSHGLFAFIRYMEQLEKYEVDYGVAGVTDEYADVVRIMSVHKSKGLEFPVCIVAGLAKRFPVQDQAKSLLMDVDMGLGCEYVDIRKRLQRTTLRRNVLARRQQLDNLGEELRILYVAMTRAREKLILTGCISEPAMKLTALGRTETAKGWTGQGSKSSFLTLSTAGSLLDFLLPVAERIRVIEASELKKDEVEAAVLDSYRRRRLEEYEAEGYVEQWKQLFEQRFAYRYPWNLSELYTKTTVSELKMEKMTEATEGAAHLFDTEEKEAHVPRFCREEQRLTGSVRGSAFHRAMELLDFADIPQNVSKKEMTDIVNQLLERFMADRKMTEEERDCIYAAKIADFLLTDVAGRMRRADRKGLLKKEQPFMLGLPANRVREEFPAGETVLIQGIIDVCWEEDGEIVVLDYKTDRVDREEELISRYQTQLAYYGEALATITGKRVKELLIYSFHFGSVCGLQEQPMPSPP
ncbi:helicase-exonuclease AddAB subunit AddA [Lachnospiraceae bacterium JLR.KK008]